MKGAAAARHAPSAQQYHQRDRCIAMGSQAGHAGRQAKPVSLSIVSSATAFKLDWGSSPAVAQVPTGRSNPYTDAPECDDN